MMNLNKSEQNTLLYLETCLVDQRGRVEGKRTNDKDMDNIKKFVSERLIHFGRIPFKIMEQLRKQYRISPTHWVEFTPEAWGLAHRLRIERSERMIRNVPLPAGNPKCPLPALQGNK